MADRIKGITIEIGGDTTALSKALKGVNAEIRQTQSQLKDVEQLLKLDPGNTELLAQKERLLKQEVEKTAEKLEALQKAQEQVNEAFEKGEASVEQVEALQREIVATQAALVDATKNALSFNQTLTKVGVAAQNVGNQAQAVANATRGLSAAAGGALAALTALGLKAVTSADDLNTLSKQTGLSTETLQTMAYAADLVDVETTAVTGAIKKLKGNLDSHADTWATLGVNVKTAAGEYRDIEDIFNDTIVALSKVENETERDQLAMDLLGKSADQLAGIIDDGGEAWRKYGEAAQAYVLDQETLNRLNEINDVIDTTKMQAAGTLAVTGAKAAEALAPVIQDIAEGLSKVLGFLGSLSPAMIETLIAITGIVALVSPIAGTIAKVAFAVNNVTILLQTLGPVIAAVHGGISALMGSVTAFIAANPIAILVAAIIALVALIATKGDEIKAILQKVDDFFTNIFAADFTNIFGPILGGVLNHFFDAFQLIWSNIKTVLDGVISFIQAVFSGNWQAAWDAVKGIFTGVFDNIYNFATEKLQGVIDFINKVIGLAGEALDKLNEVAEAGNDSKGNRVNGGNQNHNTWSAWDAITNAGLPLMANGGSIVGSGAAIVGEAGPELLSLSNGRATVTPINVTMNNTFGNYNNAAGAAAARDLARQIDMQLGRNYK